MSDKAQTDYESDLAALDQIFERFRRGEATVEADLAFLVGFAKGQASRIRDLERKLKSAEEMSEFWRKQSYIRPFGPYSGGNYTPPTIS